MTPILRRALLAACCSFLVLPLSAQRVRLTPYPTDGTFDASMVQDMSMTMSLDTDDSTLAATAGLMEQQMAIKQMQYSTITVTTHGAAKHLRVVTDRVRVEGTLPGQGEMVFDSADPDGAAMMGLAPQAEMIGTPVEMRFEDGALTVVNLDSLVASMFESADPEAVALQRDALEEMFTQMFTSALAMLPAEPVGVGDAFDMEMNVPMASMGTMQMNGRFMVEAVEGSAVTYGGPFTVTSSMQPAGSPMALEMEGEGTMHVVYDAATGEQQSTTDMTLAATMDMSGMAPDGARTVMKMGMSIKQTFDLTLRDE